MQNLERFAEKLEIMRQDQKFNAIRYHSMTTLVPHLYRMPGEPDGILYNNLYTVLFSSNNLIMNLESIELIDSNID